MKQKMPIAVKTKKGYAIMHESGLYFLDEDDNIEKRMDEISKKKRPEVQIDYSRREKIAKVVIYLSSNCNLRCIYCYASAGVHNEVVSVDNAKALISFVAAKVDRLILDFHGGGEPLLHFDIIQELHDYAKKTGKLYRTVLISNGVIEKDQKIILDWIVNNVDVMALSCDGFPEIQNEQRPSVCKGISSFRIEETIKYFNEKKYVYTVRSTITKRSSEKLLEITKYFHDLGVKYLVYSPCYNFGRTDDVDLVPDPKIYVENYMKAIKFAYDNKMRLTSNSFRYPGYHYCGALAGFNIALTTDNYISSCYEVVSSRDETANMFIIGKVENGKVEFFNKKIDALEQIDITDNYCINCNYRLVCRGGCPVKKVRGSKDSLNNLCAITRCLVPEMLDFLQEHPEAASSVLKNVVVDA